MSSQRLRNPCDVYEIFRRLSTIPTDQHFTKVSYRGYYIDVYLASARFEHESARYIEHVKASLTTVHRDVIANVTIQADCVVVSCPSDERCAEDLQVLFTSLAERCRLFETVNPYISMSVTNSPEAKPEFFETEWDLT